ncbi:MAG: hypothetical protein LJF04_19275 [Gemmatimonadetes bacterium]|nr:hypothetical protein [Gemmatimonadota bacterium]
MREVRGSHLVLLLVGLILAGSLVSLGLRLRSQGQNDAWTERLRSAREATSGERLLEGTVRARTGEAVEAPETGEDLVAYAHWISERLQPSRTPIFQTSDLELRAAPFDLVTPEGRFAVDGTPVGISDLKAVAYSGPRLVAIRNEEVVSILGQITDGPGGAGFHGDYAMVSATVDEWLAAVGGGPYPSLPAKW